MAPYCRSLSLAPHGAFFAGGALLYLVSTSGWSPRRAVGVVAAAVMGQASAVQSMSGFIPDIGSADTPIVRSLAVACFIAVALAATWPRTLRHPNRWAALGALTYPLYLVHARIGRLIFERLQGLMSPIGAALLVIVLVYAVAGLLAWGLSCGWCRGFRGIPSFGRWKARPPRRQSRPLHRIEQTGGRPNVA